MALAALLGELVSCCAISGTSSGLIRAELGEARPLQQARILCPSQARLGLAVVGMSKRTGTRTSATYDLDWGPHRDSPGPGLYSLIACLPVLGCLRRGGDLRSLLPVPSCLVSQC